MSPVKICRWGKWKFPKQIYFVAKKSFASGKHVIKRKECLTKITLTWGYFPKTLQYAWQGSKFLRAWILICQASEYGKDREGSE